jgi:hypothetical protein
MHIGPIREPPNLYLPDRGSSPAVLMMELAEYLTAMDYYDLRAKTLKPRAIIVSSLAALAPGFRVRGD